MHVFHLEFIGGRVPRMQSSPMSLIVTTGRSTSPRTLASASTVPAWVTRVASRLPAPYIDALVKS